jgi:acyl carrier protein
MRNLQMNDNDDRLMHCFALAFPSATSDEIRAANFDTLPGWDSLRGVTLLAVLDEEYGLQIDMAELLELATFDSVNRYILQHGRVTKGDE